MYEIYKDIEFIIRDNPEFEDVAKQMLKNAKFKINEAVKQSDKFKKDGRR